MTRRGSRRGPVAVAGAALALALAPAVAAAQGLETRVLEADGTVAFQFDLREGVEVCDDGIVVDGERRMHHGRWRDRGRENCSLEVAEAVATVRDGRVERVELEAWEGPGSAPRGARDLGRVGPGDAADFLLGLAEGGTAARRAAESGIMAATLVDGVEVWPRLLALGRDRGVDGKVRSAAVFWLGQSAADAATAGLAELAADDDEEQDVRDAAVFALSQRDEPEAVSVLMELASTAPRGRTRRTAMFWLAQSDDPRVLPFFERILREGPGGG